MDIDTVRNWAIVLSSLLSIACTAAVYMNSPGRRFEAALTKLGGLVELLEDQMLENLKSHDRRIQTIESELRHLPSASEVYQLKNAVVALEKDVSHIGDTTKSMSHMIMRIDEHLREKS